MKCCTVLSVCKSELTVTEGEGTSAVSEGVRVLRGRGLGITEMSECCEQEWNDERMLYRPVKSVGLLSL